MTCDRTKTDSSATKVGLAVLEALPDEDINGIKTRLRAEFDRFR